MYYLDTPGNFPIEYIQSRDFTITQVFYIYTTPKFHNDMVIILQKLALLPVLLYVSFDVLNIFVQKGKNLIEKKYSFSL